MRLLSPEIGQPVPAALRPLHAAIANRESALCTIVNISDSNGEGESCTARDQRYVDRLAANLRGAFPTPGVRGGAGFIPTYYSATTMPDPTTDLTANTGGTSATVDDARYGLGGRARQYKYGAAVQWTEEMTSFKIFYAKDTLGVNANVFVDGVNVGTLAGNGTASGGFVFTSAALAPGTHTVKVQTTDNAGFITTVSGIQIFYGDETKGIQVIDASKFGALTTTFGAEHFKDLTQVKPQAVMVDMISNDPIFTSAAAYATNFGNLLSAINTAMNNIAGSPAWSLIINPMNQRNNTLFGADTWAAYLQAARVAAAAYANAYFVEKAELLGALVNGEPNGLFADAVHISRKGNALLGDGLPRQLMLDTASGRNGKMGYQSLPDGVPVHIYEVSNGVWPNRPTNERRIPVRWFGQTAPTVVASPAVNGAYTGDEWIDTTP